MLNNSGINKVFIVGHVGKEPRMHCSSDNMETFCFPLVTNEFIKKNGETLEHVEWHQVRIPAEIVAKQPFKVAKGQLIYIEGKVQTRSFVDPDNIKRYKTEIVVSRTELLSVEKPEFAQMVTDQSPGHVSA